MAMVQVPALLGARNGADGSSTGSSRPHVVSVSSSKFVPVSVPHTTPPGSTSQPSEKLKASCARGSTPVTGGALTTSKPHGYRRSTPPPPNESSRLQPGLTGIERLSERSNVVGGWKGRIRIGHR